MGAHYEALDALIFMVPSVSPCIFYVPRLPSGGMCIPKLDCYVRLEGKMGKNGKRRLTALAKDDLFALVVPLYMVSSLYYVLSQQNC